MIFGKLTVTAADQRMDHCHIRFAAASYYGGQLQCYLALGRIAHNDKSLAFMAWWVCVFGRKGRRSIGFPQFIIIIPPLRLLQSRSLHKTLVVPAGHYVPIVNGHNSAIFRIKVGL